MENHNITEYIESIKNLKGIVSNTRYSWLMSIAKDVHNVDKINVIIGYLMCLRDFCDVNIGTAKLNLECLRGEYCMKGSEMNDK